MSNLWIPDPCTDPAGWTPETVCTRPYDMGPYGSGPYGRCAIIGGPVWQAPDSTSTSTQQAATRRRARWGRT